MEHAEAIENLRKALVEGDEDAAAHAAQAAIDAGVDPATLIKEAINAPMEKVGQDFQAGEIFLPELVMVGDAARTASDVIMPHISTDDQEASVRGKVVLGSIQGDMHDIGKNIVGAYMSASGLKVEDLGTDISAKQFIDAADKTGANIIAISTLLTTSQPLFRDVVRILEDSGQRDRFFVIVGGGPVTPEWAADMRADGYGRDAKDAVDIAVQLLGGDQKPPLSEPLVVGALKTK